MSTSNLKETDRQDFLPKDLLRNFCHKYAPVKNTELQLSLPRMKTNAHHDYSITHRITSKTLSGQLPPYSTFTPRNKQINNFKHPIQSFLTVLSAGKNTH